MTNKPSTANFVVYTNRNTSTGVQNTFNQSTTAQKPGFSNVSGFSNHLSCTTGKVYKN